MRAQFLQTTPKDTAAKIGVYIYDGSGVALTGLSASDIRVTYLKQDDSALTSKTVSSIEEVGGGKYNISFTAAELDTPGFFIVVVTPAVGYVGTMRQSTKPVAIADTESYAGGFLQDRAQWVPVQALLSSVPVGGILYSAISLAGYQKQGDATYTAVAITATNFREVLDGATARGLYQVYLEADAFDAVGSFEFRLQGTGFDNFYYSYSVSKAETRSVYITVEEDGVGRSDVTVYAVDEESELVIDTGITDGLGQVLFELPDGDYVFVMAYGNEIFDENNYRLTVVDPDGDISDAEPAEVLAASQAPYVLTDGMTLIVQVTGGEIQTIELEAADFVAPATISSAFASVVAEILNLKGHSFLASAAGLNGTQLKLETRVAGEEKTIQVLGGTANAVFNFPTTLSTGTDATRQTNYLTMNGASFQPGFLASASDLVEMTFRIVDIAGAPVKGIEVVITNAFGTIVRASDGSAVLGRKHLQCFTDADGVLQEDYRVVRPGESRGKPKLIKGSVIDVVISGTNIVKQGITVPQTNFNLTDAVLSAEDIFTIQRITLPRAPRSSP